MTINNGFNTYVYVYVVCDLRFSLIIDEYYHLGYDIVIGNFLPTFWKGMLHHLQGSQRREVAGRIGYTVQGKSWLGSIVVEHPV